jgi:tetratricopeptide (TPR) repeat protein
MSSPPPQKSKALGESIRWILPVFLVLVAFYPTPMQPEGYYPAGALVCVMGLLLLVRPLPRGPKPLALQWTLFLLFSLAAILWAPDWARAARKGSWLVLGYLLFWLGWAKIRSGQALRRLQWTLVGVALLVTVYSLWRHFTVRSDPQFIQTAMELISDRGRQEDLLYALSTRRLSGPFGNPNHLAGYLVACITPCLLVVLRGRAWKNRLLAGLVLLPVLITIYLTGSRSGFLTLVLATGIVLMGAFSEFRKNIFHWKLSPMKVGILLLLLIGAAFVVSESWVAISRVGTVKTRLEYYRVAWEAIQEAPLFGQGLESYALIFPLYHRLGFGQAQYVHNWPLQVMVEMGIVGLGLFLWWIGSIFQLFNQELAAVQNPDQESALLALMGSLSAIGLQSLLDFNTDVAVIFLCFSLFTGALSGMAAGRTRSEGEPAPRPERSDKIFRTAAVVGILLFFTFGLIFPYYAEMAHQTGLDYVRDEPRSPQALGQLSLAVRLHPFHSDYRTSLGSHLRALGFLDKAEEHFRKAVRLSPEKARHHFNLSRVLSLQGKRQEAEQHLKKAHELHPTEVEYLRQLAQWAAAEGREELAESYREEAIEILLRATEANPGRAEFQRQLAELYRQQGNVEAAREHEKEAERIFQEILDSFGGS